MSALEQEIFDKLMQLDESARRRVIQLAEQSLSPASVSWLDQARALRSEMRTKYGKLSFSAAQMVNDVREERLNELMDRY